VTISFPDISSYEAGLMIQSGTVAVIAKATEGTYYRDAQYANFKAQAAHVGAVFSAYHFLKAGNGAGQADYCHAMVGSTPVMLDVETEGTSKPTVADCAAFIARMHDLGGRVWGAYFPQWYWQQVGGNLASLGVAIVSSNYTTYSDSGPGWAPYGGVSPTVWQYTDKQSYGGQTIDFNAYKGTVAQLAALINGTASGGSAMAMLDSTDARTIWAYSHGDAPDVHQTLDNAAAWAGAANAKADTISSKADGINNKLDQLLARPAAPVVDVAALEAAIVAQLLPHLNGNVDVNALATILAPAIVSHLGLEVVAK